MDKGEWAVTTYEILQRVLPHTPVVDAMKSVLPLMRTDGDWAEAAAIGALEHHVLPALGWQAHIRRDAIPVSAEIVTDINTGNSVSAIGTTYLEALMAAVSDALQQEYPVMTHRMRCEVLSKLRCGDRLLTYIPTHRTGGTDDAPIVLTDINSLVDFAGAVGYGVGFGNHMYEAKKVYTAALFEADWVLKRNPKTLRVVRDEAPEAALSQALYDALITTDTSEARDDH